MLIFDRWLSAAVRTLVTYSLMLAETQAGSSCFFNYHLKVLSFL